MADPRLNSIHLDGTRRQDFRRAREMLLAARGWQTLAAENQAALLDRPDTIDQENGQPPPADPAHGHYWHRERAHVYPLKVGMHTLGRAADNDVVLQDCYVSRRHGRARPCVARLRGPDPPRRTAPISMAGRIGGPSRLTTGDEIRTCDRQLVFFARTRPRTVPGNARLADDDQWSRPRVRGMRWAWRIGRLFGIDVYIHVTFPLLLAWFVVGHYIRRDWLDALGELFFILVVFRIIVLTTGPCLAARATAS
jgi:hypothetical protein